MWSSFSKVCDVDNLNICRKEIRVGLSFTRMPGWELNLRPYHLFVRKRLKTGPTASLVITPLLAISLMTILPSCIMIKLFLPNLVLMYSLS